ncbi:uncharacterized protein ARMOST_18421 [Armillaria ostoyae]|uniref:Uncharacterized protein n=1 Tax=Armillaria ostoyae TaxID=47428 RepID=A0A284S1S3_ARMOS|nr:uncharacterized protein ARMOST_18421 [Armillaria ostoyae]
MHRDIKEHGLVNFGQAYLRVPLDEVKKGGLRTLYPHGLGAMAPLYLYRQSMEPTYFLSPLSPNLAASKIIVPADSVIELLISRFRVMGRKKYSATLSLVSQPVSNSQNSYDARNAIPF